MLVGGVAFGDAFGESVEWSFACPGIGMAFADCALLMSDFAVDVVPGVSFATSALPATPITFARGSFSAAVVVFGLAGDAGLSEQPDNVTMISRAKGA